MTNNPDKDPALAPSADSPTENRRKLKVGKGMMLFLLGIAILAFALYLLVGLRAVSNV